MTHRNNRMRTLTRWPRSRLIAVGIVALTIAAIAAIVVASSSGVSTEQAIANANPPPAGPTTATVERRPLVEAISVRGVIAAPNTVEVRVPQTAGDDATSVLTALPVAAGASIGPRTVVAEVSGRPVIVLKGDRPFYRDLRFDDKGADVTSLQVALGAPPSGTFDAKTQAALEDLYTSVGYTVPAGRPSETTEGSAASQTAGDTLVHLRDALEDAQIEGQSAIDAASADADAARRLQASGEGTSADVDKADEALDEATEARDRSVARAKRDLDAATRQVERQALVEGAFLARGEIVVSPSEPLTVVSLPLGVGAEPEAGDVIAVLGDSTLEGVAYVSPLDAKDLDPGMPASLTGVELGGELPATIIDVVRETPSGGGEEEGSPEVPVGAQATPELPMQVRFALLEPAPAHLLGVGVLMTIEVRSTESTVLAVPLVALQQVGGEDVVVTVDDHKRWVVETGMAAEGWIELKAGSPPEGSKVETR